MQTYGQHVLAQALPCPKSVEAEFKNIRKCKNTRRILVMISDQIQPSKMSLKILQQPKIHHGILMNSLNWDNLSKRWPFKKKNVTKETTLTLDQQSYEHTHYVCWWMYKSWQMAVRHYSTVHGFLGLQE